MSCPMFTTIPYGPICFLMPLFIMNNIRKTAHCTYGKRATRASASGDIGARNDLLGGKIR